MNPLYIICIISWDFIFFSWVRNKIIPDHMIEVLDDVKKIIQFLEKLPKSKCPNSKNYINVKTSLDDPLVIALLHFFSYVTVIVEPFLKQFEIDKSMTLFLFFDLKAIIACLLEIILQPEVIESCKSARQLKEIDLTDKAKLLAVDKINNDLSDVIVNKLKWSDATPSQIKEFKEGA